MDNINISKENLDRILKKLVDYFKTEIDSKDLSLPYKDQLDKADILKIDGDGNSFLNMNGEYFPIDLEKLSQTKENIQSIKDLFSIVYSKENWEQKKSTIPTGRYSGSSILYDNFIYVIGGYQNGGTLLKSNEKYDIITDTWETKANMITGRNWLGASLFNNCIYVIGGESKNNNECYNIESNTWTTKTNIPTSGRSVSCGTYNSKIYCIMTGSQLNQVYNPSTNTWETKVSKTKPVNYPGFELYKNCIYCINSDNNNSINEVYNCDTNIWTTKSPKKTPTNRFSTSILAEELYCFGGIVGGTVTNITESYNIELDIWSSKLNMPININAHVSETYDSNIYILSGVTSNYFMNSLCYSPENIDYSLDLSSNPTLSKVDILINSGDGTKYLADNGQYISIKPTINPISDTNIQSIIDSL